MSNQTKKNETKPRYLQRGEVEYIRKNCLSMSDEELARELGRDTRTIKRCREKLGISKTYGGRVHTLENQKKRPEEFINHDTEIESAVSKGQLKRMTDGAKAEFFKTELVNSLFYDNIKRQFSEEEIDFYLEEWSALCIQFEDIIQTEKRQIDELIKNEIMGNRILRNVKVVEDAIEDMIKRIEQFREDNDVIEDEEAQTRDEDMSMMLRQMNAQSNSMSSDYQKVVDIRNKILQQLNARRQDRIDQIKSSKSNFFDYIESLKEDKNRHLTGQWMELLRAAKDKKKSEWRRASMFPDGKRDCILMDENSQEIDGLELSVMSSKMLAKYFDTKEKEILILENDSERVQFFTTCFSDHNIEIASNVTKALDQIKDKEFDLVMLDYDLGLDQKSKQFVDYILNKNKLKNTDFIIHSNNPDGREELVKMLTGEREFDVYPFSEMMDNIGEFKNGKNSTA